MVLPVAGNTFEPTPGHRARDAVTTPRDAVHGTLDRAIVMVNTEHAMPPPAERRLTPTLRTAGSMALVVPATSAGAERYAATAPAPTQTTTARTALDVEYRTR